VSVTTQPTMKSMTKQLKAARLGHTKNDKNQESGLGKPDGLVGIDLEAKRGLIRV